MDFLKNGIKSVLGSGELVDQSIPGETVEKLVDRLMNSTLLNDRRIACKALKEFSRKNRVEVGAQGMLALLHILLNDSQDTEIVTFSLETLCNILTKEIFEEENSYMNASNVGEQFTEMFFKNYDHVNLVLKYLEEYDFCVRRAAIKLVTILLANKTREMQHIILVSPMCISKLMDLLSDKREVIRNDVLLLLIQLTKTNYNIQKIVAFENAFDKIFEIIRCEGYSDGGIIVEDCLIIALNLLKNNSSNQQFFKEGSFIKFIPAMFTVSKEIFWTPQRVSNFHCMLQVVRSLIAPTNEQQVVTSCQIIMRQYKLLEVLCNILMSAGVPVDVLSETINVISEFIRGNSENQNDFLQNMAPSNPPRSIIVVLLMSMINEKQTLSLRCAVLYAFQSYLFKNEKAQKKVVSTLLPSAVDEKNLSIGQILCTGLFSSDVLANWFSSVSLMHSFVDNNVQKEELIRVLLLTTDNKNPVSLLDQCLHMLQQDNCKLQSKIGLLMLLSMWLAHCPCVTNKLLDAHGVMPYLIALVTGNEQDENELLVQGMVAFLMGLCVQFNDNKLSGQSQEEICQLILKRVGKETFCNKLIEVSRHEAYTRTCKQPQIKANTSSELLLDYEYCKLYKNLESNVSKLINEFHINGVTSTEFNLRVESAVVTEYKNIIRTMDEETKTLHNTIRSLESQKKSLGVELSKLLNSNMQLSDQNTLLKAQLALAQNELTLLNNDKICSKVSNEHKCLYESKNIDLSKNILVLHQKLSDEKELSISRANTLQKLQRDQEDLLILLSEQENKIRKYEQQLLKAHSK